MNAPSLSTQDRPTRSLSNELGEAEYERLVAIWFKKWDMPATTPIKRDKRTPAQRAYVREMARHECAAFAGKAGTA